MLQLRNWLVKKSAVILVKFVPTASDGKTARQGLNLYPYFNSYVLSIS